jgi:hypothetical protein
MGIVSLNLSYVFGATRLPALGYVIVIATINRQGADSLWAGSEWAFALSCASILAMKSVHAGYFQQRSSP